MNRRQMISVGLGCAWACAVPARASEPQAPASVLIATSVVSAPELQAPNRKFFEDLYNGYMAQVQSLMAQQFRNLGIPAATYVHRDLTTGRRTAVVERLFAGGHDALVQLDFAFEGGPTGNRTLLNCTYMRLEKSAREGMAKFGHPFEKRYTIMGENVGEGPGSGTVASDFVRSLRNAGFGNAR